ncbi:cytochrome c biogenesis heme-transporting ATPase CcmA [Glaciecola sp. 1036]|uniref:cytochrome c biogenesis heme-transporting ATPase CcmA n=1 Tax=Alteromonadaceae TaxID=72275 RepID=UPI003D052B60
MKILELSGVSCEKQDRELFHNINLTLTGGELLFLKGENGAGKTSLIRIITGLSRPTSGDVLIQQENIHKYPDAAKKLVYCGHKLGLNANLSALENLGFWCQLHGKPVDNAELQIVLENLGLEGLEDLPVKHLSAGQQRRASLAKLWLSTNASLWVLDEPFTALDVNTVKLLCHQVDSFVNAGGAVVMTSHQQVELTCKTSEFYLEYHW